jgi:tetratricopeptide (TPR) repeat protein
MGDLLAHGEKYEDALTCFQRLLRLDRSHTSSWIDLAACYTKNLKHIQAFSVLEQARSEIPNNASILFLLAESAIKLGRRVLACYYLDLCLKLDPHNSEASNILLNLREELEAGE